MPTTYKGIPMRSKLEANWAATLDHFGIEWQYEPQVVQLETEVLYLPDFWLPVLSTLIEVKGVGVPRTYKVEQLARELPPSDVVLIGFPPMRRCTSPYLWESFLLWRDAAGYDTRLARCGQCSAWQWLRPQISRACRICGTPYRGLLAKPGEMRFHDIEPEPLWTERA